MNHESERMGKKVIFEYCRVGLSFCPEGVTEAVKSQVRITGILIEVRNLYFLSRNQKQYSRCGVALHDSLKLQTVLIEQYPGDQPENNVQEMWHVLRDRKGAHRVLVRTPEEKQNSWKPRH
jgi:hypothetical protein